MFACGCLCCLYLWFLSWLYFFSLFLSFSLALSFCDTLYLPLSLSFFLSGHHPIPPVVLLLLVQILPPLLLLQLLPLSTPVWPQTATPPTTSTAAPRGSFCPSRRAPSPLPGTRSRQGKGLSPPSRISPSRKTRSSTTSVSALHPHHPRLNAHLSFSVFPDGWSTPLLIKPKWWESPVPPYADYP